MDENSTKILIAIIAVIASIIGGISFYSKKKRKNYSVNQENINITGNDNKIVGGDDKSGK